MRPPSNASTTSPSRGARQALGTVGAPRRRIACGFVASRVEQTCGETRVKTVCGGGGGHAFAGRRGLSGFRYDIVGACPMQREAVSLGEIVNLAQRRQLDLFRTEV